MAMDVIAERARRAILEYVAHAMEQEMPMAVTEPLHMEEGVRVHRVMFPGHEPVYVRTTVEAVVGLSGDDLAERFNLNKRDDGIKPHHLVNGKRYRIRHRSGTQRHERESVMVYLGPHRYNQSTQWSARPVAGTQELPNAWVLRIDEVADDAEIYVDRVIRPAPELPDPENASPANRDWIAREKRR